MTTLQERLARACDELGLHIDLDFVASLPSGRQVLALVRIADLGGTNGILIVRSFDEVRALSDELLAAGYGYSVLSEPNRDEEFDLESFVEMFSEWGWAGGERARPTWLVGDIAD